MIAIIIPYYKINFFQETLESLAAQCDQRFHAYIGNDASPDDPEKLLKNFEGKFNFTYKKFDENLGGTSLTKQWERCLDMMQGECWFMILGDDDYMEVNAIKQFHETVSINSTVFNVLRFNFIVINEIENAMGEETVYIDKESSSDFIVKRALGIVRSSLSEYVFRTDCFYKYGIKSFPKGFYSDNLMVLEYSNFGPVKNINKGKVFIRVSNFSVSGSENNYSYLIESGYIFYTYLLTRYEKKFSKQQKRSFLQYAFDGYLVKNTDISFLRLFRLIYQSSSYVKTIDFLILYLKNKAVSLLKT